ncbi:MAG: hypothetical protein HYV09_40230 [Deltaproteobacteria bacterium]|nr:hypothetical protein [Deltaproteobacteria bacterium]
MSTEGSPATAFVTRPMLGLDLRLGDALALQAGYTLSLPVAGEKIPTRHEPFVGLTIIGLPTAVF